jgi:hypothetical protein
MDIQTTKLELLKSILEIDSKDLIEKLKEIISDEKEDFWHQLTDAEKKDIKDGIEELDQGKRISYGEFLKKI